MRDEQHLRRGKNCTLCSRGAPTFRARRLWWSPEPALWMHSGPSRSSRMAVSHTADRGGSKGGASVLRPVPPAKRPQTVIVRPNTTISRRIDEADKDHIQHAGQHADKARCQGHRRRTQHGRVVLADHQKGRWEADQMAARPASAREGLAPASSGQKAVGCQPKAAAARPTTS